MSRHDKIIEELSSKGLETKGFMSKLKKHIDYDFGTEFRFIPDAFKITGDCIHIFEVSCTHRVRDKINKIISFYEYINTVGGMEVFLYEIDATSKSIALYDMEDVSMIETVNDCYERDDDIGDFSLYKGYLDYIEFKVFDDFRILSVDGECVNF